ncbi:unannotated protein [freshwater metagenome]|uniref:Unannotated protein n=1 Tax=freshwater metagenome TaxID=449393 RepID=A0A6J7IZY8_9ZZZZ
MASELTLIPIPSEPMSHEGTSTATGSPGTRQSGRVTSDTTTRVLPIRTSRAGVNDTGACPWNQAPLAQPMAPHARKSPDQVVETPRTVCSESGIHASAEKNAPAMSPRTAITVGSPRLTRRVPAGSSTSSAGTSSASPTAASMTPTQVPRCAASCTATSPTAACAPARTLPVRRGSSEWAPSNWRSLGSTRNSGGQMRTTTTRNTQRHETESASQPAMTGPTIAGSTHAAERREKAFARRMVG